MGEDAVRIAKLSGYQGAGTVEFLMDADRKYYFLEMNTRLQVEHPVTEMITGLDLVEMQIRVARGEKLPIAQEELQIDGHAIELRVCAEDPENDFLPSIGVLTKYRYETNEVTRVDDGYREGMEIPIYYDPLLAKLIVHGKNRDEAISRMSEAIEHYEVKGVMTTLPFGRFVMQSEAFRSGMFDTHFIRDHYQPYLTNQNNDMNQAAALVAAFLQQRKNGTLVITSNGASKWKQRRLIE
jgi:propionyl-CoA carboxylase alpha chain